MPNAQRYREGVFDWVGTLMCVALESGVPAAHFRSQHRVVAPMRPLGLHTNPTHPARTHPPTTAGGLLSTPVPVTLQAELQRLPWLQPTGSVSSVVLLPVVNPIKFNILLMFYL